MEAVGVTARCWVAVVEPLSVDGFRDRVDVVVAPFLATEEEVEVVAEAEGRVVLAGVALVVREAAEAVGFVRSRAGIEDRTGLVVGLVAGFKDVRLGLCVATLGASAAAVLVVAGRAARVVRDALSSGLAGEVGVRGCAGDLAAGLGAGLPTWMVDGRLVTVLVCLGDETSGAFGVGTGAGGLSTTSDGFSGSTGAGSCFSGRSSCGVSKVATGCSVILWGKPFRVGETDSGLFKPPSKSSELKLLTRIGAAGLSLRPLTLRSPARGLG